MEDKTTYILGEISTMKYGKLPPKQIDKGKYPIWSGYRTVGYCNEFNCAKGDVIIVARGVGGTGDVKIAKENCYLTNLSIHVKLDCNICLPEYFYYRFLLSNLKYLDSGSAQSQITIDDLKRLTLALPPLAQQYKTVNMLRSFDNKIELNNRINHNLEEQADGIVSSLLNVGTTVLRLSDICKYVSQRIDCQSLTLNNYISTENMVPSRGGVTKSSNVPTGTAIEYSSGDILVSNIRPYFQKIWKATYSGGCSNDVLCFRSSTNSPSFLYHLLRQNSFFDHVMAGAKGSKMPRGDKAQIMNWTFVLSEDWEAMESKLSIIDKKVALLRVQNLMLIELRDSVLPRLMSGELKINDLTC